ncbi:MAG: TonB-dependent siderophore receptor [Niabella sp.]
MRKVIMLLIGVIFVGTIYAQTNSGSIEGQVVTNEGTPVEEANVQIKELGKYTRTKQNGSFKFKNIQFGQYTLIYSYAGQGEREIKVTVPPEPGASTAYQLSLNNKELEEVIITYKQDLNHGAASIGKSNIAIMDLPQSVTIIGARVMDEQQMQRLSDVVKNVNGVYVGTTRGSTQESFYARGYSFSSTNMFKNGFRVNTGTMPEISSLESVEILKGSAAILYGNVAPGGILNMVTKKPKFDFGGSVNMRIGSFNLYKPALDIYGPVSKSIAYRLNGTYENAKSYRDVVSSERVYFNPSLLFNLSKKTNLLVQGDYLKHDFTPDFGIGSLGGSEIADVPRSRFMGADWQYAKAKQSTISTELNHSFNPNWGFNFSLNYQNYHRDYFSLERIQADAAGNWDRPIGRFDNKEDYYATQANLTGKFSTGSIKHQLLVGLDADQSKNDNLTSDSTRTIYDRINLLDPNMYVRRTDIPYAPWTDTASTLVNRFGVYAQDLVHLSDKFKLLAGIRWSYQKAKDAAASEDAFSPRVGLVYQPAKNISLFTSYANSFSPNSGMDVNGKALPASFIDQYELGIKNIFFKGKLNANLTFYKIINNNLAQMVTELPDGSINSNTQVRELTGQTTSDGIELDMMAAPIRGLDIIAGYAYNNMRYTKTSGKRGSYVEGQRLVNSPAHTVNTSAFYTFYDGAIKGLKLGVGYYYTGNRMGGWNNDYADNNGTVRTRAFEVNGFGTLDFSAGYNYKNISLMAKLSNITNVYNYYVHENYSINPIPPRNIMITIGYKF